LRKVKTFANSQNRICGRNSPQIGYKKKKLGQAGMIREGGEVILVWRGSRKEGRFTTSHDGEGERKDFFSKKGKVKTENLGSEQKSGGGLGKKGKPAPVLLFVTRTENRKGKEYQGKG